MSTATLGGMTLLASRPVIWNVLAGTHPSIEVFDLMPEDATKILSYESSVKLVIDDMSIGPLWIVGEAPAENPHIRTVIAADSRFYWNYSHVYRRINMRRRIGLRRLKATNEEVVEIAPIVDNIQYHPWSLNDGTPWKAKDALSSIIKEVIRNVPGGNTSQILWKLPVGVEETPIEDLQIDDDGAGAIERIIEYLPGIKIWVDISGNIHVDSMSDIQGVLDQKQMLLPEVVGGGHIVMTDNRNRRPKEVICLFTPEYELRFDSAEPMKAWPDVTHSEGEMSLDNVLPIPDYSLEVEMPTGKTELPQGTWITLSQAFHAWKDVTTLFGELDYNWLLEVMIPFNGLLGGIQMYADLNTEVDWASRFNAVLQHYRRTFRINPDWISKISKLDSFRVATINTTTGTRGPAVCYSDFVSFFTQRMWADNRSNASNNKRAVEVARNYAGYPTDPVSINDGTMLYLIDERTKPAPAVVSVVDSEQGIIRADFIVDPLRLSDLVFPGNIVNTAMPTLNLNRAGREYAPITLDSVVHNCENSKIPKFIGGHKMAFILTAVPGSPNDTSMLHPIAVKPGDLGLKLGPCSGPTMYIRIPSSIETARFAWDDAYCDDIKAVFGVGLKAGVKVSPEAVERVRSLCVNALVGSKMASLQNIAWAASARVYSQLIDHPVGGAVGCMNPEVTPAGWIKNVTHELSTSGEKITHIAIPDKMPEVSLFRYMDSGTRAVVLKIVQH